jgi:hypothetical protein
MPSTVYNTSSSTATDDFSITSMSTIGTFLYSTSMTSSSQTYTSALPTNAIPHATFISFLRELYPLLGFT